MTGFLTEILSVHPPLSLDDDSPLLRGATPFLPPRRGTCRRPRPVPEKR